MENSIDSNISSLPKYSTTSDSLLVDPPRLQVSDPSSAVREDFSHITRNQSVILESSIDGSEELSPEGGLHVENLPSADSDDIDSKEPQILAPTPKKSPPPIKEKPLSLR